MKACNGDRFLIGFGFDNEEGTQLFLGFDEWAVGHSRTSIFGTNAFGSPRRLQGLFLNDSTGRPKRDLLSEANLHHFRTLLSGDRVEHCFI